MTAMVLYERHSLIGVMPVAGTRLVPLMLQTMCGKEQFHVVFLLLNQNLYYWYRYSYVGAKPLNELGNHFAFMCTDTAVLYLIHAMQTSFGKKLLTS